MTSRRAEELLLEYLDRKDKGDPIAFDAFCARHLDVAEELGALFRGWQLGSERDANRAAPAATLAESTASTDSSLFASLTSRGSSATRYRFEGKVAQGGMGAILRVWDADLRRHLAMKVMLQNAAPDASRLSRFLEEAQVTGQLDHPGIVPVHELGVDADGRVFFTMKLVKGETLTQVFEKVDGGADGWNLTRALTVLLRVCDAMAFAHEKGVIHRDLKPGNVMVGRFGETYVMDWGLSRVLDAKETKDIRIRADATASVVRTTRRDSDSRDTPDSPLLTMDGDVVGTPAYMSPEQAQGDLERVGPQSDVYALGAMLYHLLTGRVPYVEPDENPHGRAIHAMVMHGPPRPVHQLAKEAPAELVSICEKAMARSLAHRYRSMTELADDLRAWLENRVVRAHAAGAVAELRKWVRRNRAFAAAAAIAVLAIAAGLVGVWRKNAEISKQNAALTEKSLTSGVLLLADAVAAEAELFPPWPEKIPAMERWLAVDARRIAALRPELANTIAALEARALPRTDADRESDRTGHPDFPRLRAMHARLTNSAAGDAELPEALAAASADGLNDFAWPRVTPTPAREFGEEAAALSAARAAVRKIEAGDRSVDLARTLDTLAWALFANGRDEEARAAQARALDAAGEDVRREIAENRALLDRAIETAPADLARLEATVDRRRSWRFERDDDRFLHGALTKLAGDVDAFVRDLAPRVERRLAWARRIGELTQHHPNARVSWEEARRAITLADGASASTLYREWPIDLEPQTGLVPIGMNPVTRLWEFYDLRSSCNLDLNDDPARAAIPAFRPDGSIEMKMEAGIVFVLVPGGVFTQVDLAAGADAVPQRVTLAPFFIARHELTFWQWSRLLDGEPLNVASDADPIDFGDDPALFDDRSWPVTRVNWGRCERWIRRSGLALPTEAQWEYAARAGTTTPWWSGSEPAALAGVANILDVRARARFPSWGEPETGFDDGFVGPGPVGAYRANPFGLFDVHGNVSEWCADVYAEWYTRPRAGDGLRVPRAGSDHVTRGGSFRTPASRASCASRSFAEDSGGGLAIGVRPARVMMTRR